MCSPHYHWLLEYIGYHLLDQHFANDCVVRTIIGCLNTLAVICWNNIGPMCVVSTVIIGYLLFDQPFGNVYILHYHNLLEYVSQKA